MPTLHIIAVTCWRTQETHDQAFIRTIAQVRDDRGVLRDEQHETDPRRMHDGQGRLVDLAIEFDTHVDVQVLEQDVGGNDRLGSFRLDRAWVGMGEWTQDVRWRHAHYTVTFEVTEGRARPTDYEIELQGLHCIDAQQAHDHVYLMVNGESVCNPMRMDNRDRRDGLAITRRFHRNVFVDLWEEDSEGHGSDHLGRMSLLLATVQEQVPGGSRTYRFSSRSAEGDATYELTYDLRR